MRHKKGWGIIVAMLISFFFLTSYAKTQPPQSLDKIQQQQAQLFYQTPSFPNFIKLTSSLIEKKGGEEFLLVFSAMVIDKHPDYVAQIIKNFNSYSPREKLLLYAALLANKNQIAIKDIQDNYHYQGTVRPRFDINTVKTLQINDNPKNIDRIWAAYFATGDDSYLKRILDYINTDDYMLFIGYEIMNRNYLCDVLQKSGVSSNNSLCKNNLDDLIASIQKKYPENSKQMIYRGVVIGSAIWSLEANKRQDKIVNEKINNIIKENPNLDYWKKINKVIGEKPK